MVNLVVFRAVANRDLLQGVVLLLKLGLQLPVEVVGGCEEGVKA